MIEAKAFAETAVFDGEYVTITRGRMSLVGKGETRLHISQISAVRWKPAGMFGGFIQFSVPGAITAKSGSGSQNSDARRDPHAVTFNKKQQPPFEELRTAVEAAIAARHTAPEAPQAESSIADELAKLNDLHQQGVLSVEEFASAKARLLGD
ncbi:DUF4429 domain-containing protein [Streptomyces sp. NPDC001634]|uniref:DUF4429 domain-containing protein n=1 Tax=Streptomyces sp. NPDC001634 TaxID=3154390 RepID=UPI00331FDE8C